MADLALAALANARRLEGDARSLLAGGRLPSAMTLGILGIEELGKHTMAASFFPGREASDSDWRRFWKRFRNHESKADNTLVSAWVADLFGEHEIPDARALHRMRLEATYVDVGRDGSITRPDAVARDTVESLLKVLTSELQFCEGVLGSVSAEALAETFEQFHASNSKGAGPAQRLGDRMAAMFRLGALRAGIPPDKIPSIDFQIRNTPGPEDAEQDPR